jgi:hypothetical protein
LQEKAPPKRALSLPTWRFSRACARRRGPRCGGGDVNPVELLGAVVWHENERLKRADDQSG